MTTDNNATLTATAQPTIESVMATITFLLRQAPTQSKYAGTLCAELRTTDNVKLLKALATLGLWHPSEECAVEVLETFQHWQKNYKILRFRSTPEVYRQLHEMCAQGDDDFGLVTDRHLASLSVDTAIEALIEGHDKNELKAMAGQINPNYNAVIGRNPNKEKLAQFICGHATAA